MIKLSEEEVIDWYYINKQQKLSEDFIREFADEICWISVVHFQILSEDFIREFIDKIYLPDIVYIHNDESSLAVRKFSEKFLYDFGYLIGWNRVLSTQNLSESFLEWVIKLYGKTLSSMCWGMICSQKLSENFIRKYFCKDLSFNADVIDKVNWTMISKFQDLSEEFILEFYEKVNWGTLFGYNKVDGKILNKMTQEQKLYLAINYRKILIKMKEQNENE